MVQRILIGENEAEQRLDRFLRKYLKDVSLGEIYRMIREKKVKVNGKKSKENYRLKEGDIIEIYVGLEKKVVEIREEEALQIVYEDPNLLLINKEAGVLMHPTREEKEHTLIDRLLYHLYKEGQYNPEKEVTFKPSFVNRLDRNTSGMVIAAKNYKSLRLLNQFMRDGEISKYYICLVRGRIDKGFEKRSYLVKDTESNWVQVDDFPSEDSKEIITIFRPISFNDGYTLLEVVLVTGKSHQIRAQLFKLGYPIIGDPKYGDERENLYFKRNFDLNCQLLHAYKIEFKDVKEELGYLRNRVFKVSLPDYFRNIVDFLKLNLDNINIKKLL